jgi:hypothetical protein
MRKPRINAYISPKVDQRLSDVAARTGGSKAAIVDAALAAFLAPEDEEGRDAVILKRLARIDDRLERLERDMMITAETLALFVRYFLTVTPPVPEQDRSTLQAKGRDRFEHFLEQVSKRIVTGQRAIDEIVNEPKVSSKLGGSRKSNSCAPD